MSLCTLVAAIRRRVYKQLTDNESAAHVNNPYVGGNSLSYNRVMPRIFYEPRNSGESEESPSAHTVNSSTLMMPPREHKSMYLVRRPLHSPVTEDNSTDKCKNLNP